MLNSWVKVARANRQAQLATSHLFQNAGFIFLGHPNETPHNCFLSNNINSRTLLLLAYSANKARCLFTADIPVLFA